MCRITLFLLMLTGLLVLGACGQKKANLNDELIQSYDLSTKNISCKKLRFDQNVLQKENILHVFHCLDWAKEYPEILKYLREQDVQDLNILLAPFDKTFFQNVEARDSFLNFILTTFKKSEIKQLSLSLKEIFDQKELISILMKFVDHESSALPAEKTFLKLVELTSILTHKNHMQRLHLKKVLESSRSLSFFDLNYQRFLQSVGESLITNSEHKFKQLSLFVGDGSWPYAYIQKYTVNELAYLLSYANDNSDIYQDLIFLEGVIRNQKYNCSDFNGIYAVNFEAELSDRLSLWASADKREFTMDLIRLSERFTLFNHVCPYQAFNPTSAKILNHLRNIGLAPGGYELLKVLSQVGQGVDDDYLLFKLVGSSFFKTLGELVQSDQENDLALLSGLYEILTRYDQKDYVFLSEALSVFFEDALKDKMYFDEIFDSEDKKNIIKYAFEELFLGENTNTNSNSLLKILGEYPALYKSVANTFQKNKAAFKNILFHLVKNLENPSLVEELKRFWSEDNFFKLIFLLMNDEAKQPGTQAPSQSLAQNIKEEFVTVSKPDTGLYTCVNSLHEAAKSSYELWDFLDAYSKSCMDFLPNKSFTSNIFQWTVEIDDLFLRNFNGRFSLKHGMLSPQMMSYYHSLLHMVNTQINKEDNYIKNIVTDIKEELFQKGLIEFLDTLPQAILAIDDKVDLIDKTLTNFIQLQPKKFDANFKHILKLFTQENLPEVLPHYDCRHLSPLPGAITCPSLDEAYTLYLDLKKYLFRDTGASQRLYESLVDFLIPSKGIKIPFAAKNQRIKVFNLDEFVQFVYDLSSPSTEKDIRFYQQRAVQTFKADHIERLETVVREISFLNNFYGAFFMNNVSRAQNYRKKVASLKKNISIMGSTSGFFRRRGIFPPESEWAFKNIAQTYDALIELDTDSYTHSGRTYGDFIQALLTMVVETSSLDSQKFTPFQTPRPQKVSLHNGMFITKLAQYSVLGHLGQWVRKISNNDINTILKNEKFQKVSQRFFTLIDPKQMKEFMHTLLNHKNSDIFVHDLLLELNRLEEDDRGRVLHTFLNGVYVITNVGKDVNLNQLTSFISIFLDNYDQIKTSEKLDFKGVIRLLDEIFETLSSYSKKEQEATLEVFLSLSDMISPENMRQLLADQATFEQIKKMSVQFFQYLKNERYNSGFLLRLLQDQDLNFFALHQLFQKNNSLYFKNILRALVIKQNQQTNLVNSLEEIFIKKDDELVEFLTDIFSKFSRVKNN